MSQCVSVMGAACRVPVAAAGVTLTTRYEDIGHPWWNWTGNSVTLVL